MITDKVKDMLEKKLLQYVNTSGNTHMFQAKNGWVVEITIEEEFTDITQVRNKIKLHCNCPSFTYCIGETQRCKHTDCAQEIMKLENLRRTYRIITVDNIDKETQGMIKYEQDGNGKIKIKSDDD